MKYRSISDLNAEMSRLIHEHVESLENQTFVTPNEEQLQKEKERLQRIREVSAEYLAVIKRSSPED